MSKQLPVSTPPAGDPLPAIDETSAPSRISFLEEVDFNTGIAVQRYHSLGVLAADLMHEFNNAMMTLLVSQGLIQKLGSLSSDQQQIFSRMQDVILKASKSTALLLEYARFTADHETVVEINSLVKEAFQLARDRFSPAVTPVLETSAQDLYSRGNPCQLMQALLNGMLNSTEALKSGGFFHVRTGLAEPSQMEFLSPEIPVMGQDYLTVTISDSGEGLSPEIEEPIRPCNSTRGRGRGLGLWVTSAIIQRHHGFLHLAPQAPRGALLTLWLPRTQPAPGNLSESV